MIPPQVGQLLTHQPPQPAHQRGFVLAGELGKLPDDLDQGLLNHVGKLQPLAQPGTQAGPHDHPQVVPVQRAQFAQRSGLARACPGQQFDRSIGHQCRLFFLRLRPTDARGAGCRSGCTAWLREAESSGERSIEPVPEPAQVLPKLERGALYSSRRQSQSIWTRISPKVDELLEASFRLLFSMIGLAIAKGKTLRARVRSIGCAGLALSRHKEQRETTPRQQGVEGSGSVRLDIASTVPGSRGIARRCISP